MIRYQIGLMILGGAVIFFGIQELIVSHGASSKPVPVELTDLEKGKVVNCNHIELGKHRRLYPLCVYRYKTSSFGNSQPDLNSQLYYTYYPVLSTEHPVNPELDAWAEEFGGWHMVPPTAATPRMDGVAVLVKTSQFKILSNIPFEPQEAPSIRGMVINSIHGLKEDEKKLLTEGFPGLNVDKILVLEENRTPTSIFKVFGIAVGGLLIILAGLAWMLFPYWSEYFGKSSAPAANDTIVKL